MASALSTSGDRMRAGDERERSRLHRLPDSASHQNREKFSNEKNPDDREIEKGVNEPELSSQKVYLTA